MYNDECNVLLDELGWPSVVAGLFCPYSCLAGLGRLLVPFLHLLHSLTLLALLAVVTKLAMGAVSTVWLLNVSQASFHPRRPSGLRGVTLPRAALLSHTAARVSAVQADAAEQAITLLAIGRHWSQYVNRRGARQLKPFLPVPLHFHHAATGAADRSIPDIINC